MTRMIPRTARWIDVHPEGVAALMRWGWDLPDGEECALLGLDPDLGPVPGAIPQRLLPVATLVWWAGPRDALRRWCRQSGVRPARRWVTAWRTARAVVLLGEVARVMGVLNVTPDSFSDGGRFPTVASQLAQVDRLLAEGAEWVDVGAESTRPGHVPVEEDVEWERLSPLLGALPPSALARLSVDTRHASTAARVLRSGVGIVNDVSGAPDGAMRRAIEEGDAGYVYMFNRTPPMSEEAFDLATVLAGVHEHLANLTTLRGGLGRVAVDPGLGFAYAHRGNLAVLRNLALFRLWDRPLLVGGSRKRFLGRLTGRDVGDRDVASAALAALAVMRGADIIRAHAVQATRDAILVAEGLAADD